MSRRDRRLGLEGPENTPLTTLIHTDLHGRIEQLVTKHKWSKHFSELAYTAAHLWIYGDPSGPNTLERVERQLRKMSKHVSHRHGWGKLKSAFHDSCAKYEFRREGTVLNGQHRHMRMFPEVMDERRQFKRRQQDRTRPQRRTPAVVLRATG